MEGLSAISTLYHVETQLAEYLERTVYAVRDGKSFIYKFNCRNKVYPAIEPWIDEIVKGFFEPSRSHRACRRFSSKFAERARRPRSVLELPGSPVREARSAS